MKCDVVRLKSFLQLVPSGISPVFEFRHKSWREPGVLELLARHDCALVCTDAAGRADDELITTATWGYVRLRRDSYDDAELRAWRERLEATGWTRALVFFKHEELGPELAERLLATADG